MGSSFVVGDTTRLVWDGRSPDFLAHQLGNSPAGSLAAITSLAARMLTPPLTVLPPSLSVRPSLFCANTTHCIFEILRRAMYAYTFRVARGTALAYFSSL